MIVAFIINAALFIVYAVGTYTYIWHNVIAAAVAALVLSALSQNIVLAFIAYPLLEYFTVGHLTEYSVMSIVLNAILAIYLLLVVLFRRQPVDEW